MKSYFSFKYFLLIPFLLFLFTCKDHTISETVPFAKDGILDLQGWDPGKDGIIKLDGWWEFYRWQFLTPDDFRRGISPELKGYLKVPGNWAGYMVAGKKMATRGYGTYRLLIRLNRRNHNSPLALSIKEIHTAAVLYVNGKRMFNQGSIGKNEYESKPAVYSYTIDFIPQSEHIELVIQVSNFYDENSGVWGRVKLGSSKDISLARETALIIDFFILGSILIMSFYYFFLFILRPKDKSTLYFGLFCLAVAIRIIVLNRSHILYDHFPGRSFWDILFKFEYLGFYVATPMFSLFIHTLFPDEFKRGVFYIILPIGIFFSLLVILTPPGIFVYSLNVYQLFTLLVSSYIFYVLVVALLHKRRAAVVFLADFLILFILAINDILYNIGVIVTGNFIYFGVFFVIFSQSLVLSYRYSQVFTEREKLRALDTLKSNFLANMSHEIRTPMNAILGMTALALSQKLPGKVRDFLTIIDDSAKTLLKLINDILDFSKIKAGKLSIESVEFNLVSLLDRLGNMFGDEVARKDVELITVIDEEVPTVLIGDPTRLTQILINLTSNAIKFTEHGEVVIAVDLVTYNQPEEPQTADDIGMVELIFSVGDTGIGISGPQLREIFSPFTQADSSTARKYGGTGLGLSICKDLIELMDGDIWAESSPGKGSVFYFTLYLVAKPNVPDDYIVVPDSLKKLDILIAVVNKTFHEQLAGMLRDFGFTVDSAGSGDEIITKLQERSKAYTPYDLVFVDCKMPGIGDRIILSHIKNDPLLMKIPIILMTAFSDEICEEKYGNSYFDGLIHKPINRSRLLMLIIDLFTENDRYCSIPGNTLRTGSIVKSMVKGMRLLLVEDNKINQTLARQLLEDLCIRVDVVDGGYEALEAIYHHDYDVILMDIQMPFMDGYEVTGKIRSDERFKELPIIAMTANAMKGDRERCLHHGMNDYISKPIDIIKLHSILIKWAPSKKSSLTPTPEKQAPGEDDEHCINSIDGIDITVALERLNGNKSLFMRLINDYVIHYEHWLNDIDSALAAGKIERAARLTHTLKGVSGSIGADEVLALCTELESVIRNEGGERIKVLLDETNTALQKVIGSIKKSIGGKKALPGDTPTAGHTAMVDIAPLLEKLYTLIVNNNFNAGKIFEQLQGDLIARDCQNEVRELKEYLDVYDYNGAKTIVEKLVRTLGLNPVPGDHQTDR